MEKLTGRFDLYKINPHSPNVAQILIVMCSGKKSDSNVAIA